MRKAILTALFMATTALTPAIAQDEEGGNVTRVFYFDVNNGANDQFKAGIASYWACVAENGGEWSWDAWRPASGHLGTVMFRSGDHDWADFDMENPAGPACSEVFESLVAPHIGDAYSGFRVTTPYSRTEEGSEITLVYGISFDFVDSRKAEDLIEAFHEAAVANEWGKYVWISHVTSTKGWDMSVAVLNENYADMAPDGPGFWENQATYHGEEEAEAMRKEWIDNVKKVKSQLWQRDEDLSYSADTEE